MKIGTLMGGVVLAMISAASAHAKGQHIVCPMTFTLNNKGQSTAIDRSLGFYLDDTTERIVSESEGILVTTTFYSDARIEARIRDEMLVGDFFLFGEVTDGKVELIISRTTGRAVVAGKLLPNGAIIGIGDCQKSSSPATKF